MLSLKVLSTSILKNQKIAIPAATVNSNSIPHHQQQHRNAHSVPIYLLKPVPNKGSTGQIVQVKAGYARNYLIPKKYAIYATEENLKRVGIYDISDVAIKKKFTFKKKTAVKEAPVDVDNDTVDTGENEDKRQADILIKYLKEKPLTIWRNIDPNAKLCHPGMVDTAAVREKLSKQLKIDLEEHETIYIKPEPFEEATDKIEDFHNVVWDIVKNDDSFSMDVQLKRLGTYVCKIGLAGGFDVPLILIVKKR